MKEEEPHAAYRRRARRRTVLLVRHRGARRSERKAAGNGLLPPLRLPHAGRRAGQPQWPGVLPALRRDEPDRVGDRQRPVLRSQCRAVYDLGLRRHQGPSTGQDQRNPGRREGRLLRRHQSARPVQPAHGFLPIPGGQQSLRFCRLEPHAERDRGAGVAGGRRQRVYVRRLCHSLAEETAARPGDHAAQRFRRRRDRHHRQPVRTSGRRPGRKAFRGPASCHSGGPGQCRQARGRLGESQTLVARCAAAVRCRHHHQRRRPRDRHPPHEVRLPRVDLGPRPVHAQRRAVPRTCRLLRPGHARGSRRPVAETRPEHDAVLGDGLEGAGPGPGPGLLRPPRRDRPPHGTFRRRGRQLCPGGKRQGERQGRDPRPQGPLRQLGQAAQGRGPGRAEPPQHHGLVDRERDHLHQLSQLGPGAVGRAGHPRHRPRSHEVGPHAPGDDRRRARHDGPVDAHQRRPLRRKRDARLPRRGLYLRQALPPTADDLEVRHDQARFPG